MLFLLWGLSGMLSVAAHPASHSFGWREHCVASNSAHCVQPSGFHSHHWISSVDAQSSPVVATVHPSITPLSTQAKTDIASSATTSSLTSVSVTESYVGTTVNNSSTTGAGVAGRPTATVSNTTGTTESISSTTSATTGTVTPGVAQINLQQFGLLQVDGTTTYNNVKITWPAVEGAASYNILRSSTASSDPAEFSVVAYAPATLADDYNLPSNTTATWYYIIHAVSTDNTTIHYSSIGQIALSPTPRSQDIATISNYYNSTVFSTELSPTKRNAGDSYAFGIAQDPNNDDLPMIVQHTTSSDGSKTTTTVLSSEKLCEPANGTCRIESQGFHTNSATGETVLWAHYEGASGYTLAEVVVAWGKPNAQWTFGGAFRPTGRDSRDLSFFTDQAGVAYLISATSMNSDTAIYQLTPDWHDVADLAAMVLVGENREAPSVLYSDGWYYLFTSHAAGWFPSDGGVISTQSIAGNWSVLADPGSTATFGAQSGWISGYGNTSLMNAERWAASWPFPQESRTLALPVTVSGGFASYHFYNTIEQDALNKVALGIQSGRLLSIGAPCSSSGGTNESAANDGATNNQISYFEPTAVPFWYEVDLGTERPIRQIDLTTRLIGGSETYYNFNVTASKDGSSYETISDQSSNKNVGFTSLLITDEASARYVRINVENVTNINNGAEADWAAGIYEFSVYTH